MIWTKTQCATGAEARRRDILEATLRVVAAGGVDSVTHRRVATEASVPLGSTTYYFESREDLIREAFRLYIADSTAFIHEVQAEIPPTSPAGLAGLILEIMRREFTLPAMVRAEYELILHAARDEQVAKALASWERMLEALLAAPLEAMGARRPLNAARTVLHIVRGYELQQLAHREETLDELRERLLTVIAALIAPPLEQAPPLARRTRKPASTSAPPRRRATA